MINVDEILREFEDELLGGKKSLFGGKIVADHSKVTELLSKLRNNLPDSIHNANRIIREQEEILKEANQRADNICRDARERANTFVAESTIMQNAERKAAEIIKEAEEYRDKMYYSVNTNLEKVLKETESVMGESIMLIHETREQLVERINKLNYRPN